MLRGAALAGVTTFVQRGTPVGDLLLGPAVVTGGGAGGESSGRASEAHGLEEVEDRLDRLEEAYDNLLRQVADVDDYRQQSQSLSQSLSLSQISRRSAGDQSAISQ